MCWTTATAFGAIALVRDVGRTATVRAISPLTLLGVPREDFLEAVTGSPRQPAHGHDDR